MNDPNTPKITLAQILSAITAIGGLLVDGLYISGRLEHVVVGVAAIVLPIVWTIADAIIRSARAHAHATIVAAKATAAASPPVSMASTFTAPTAANAVSGSDIVLSPPPARKPASRKKTTTAKPRARSGR